MRAMRNRVRGITLLELMVALSVAAVILAIGAPSFAEFRRNNRLTSAGNDFLAAIQVARTEAIKRQQPVAVCPTAAPENPGAGCSAGPFRSWLVFVDENNNCQREAGEERLRAEGPLSDAVEVRSNGVCISFAATGFLQPPTVTGQPTASRTIFCDERGIAAQDGTTLSAARGVFVSPTGRSRVTRDITSGTLSTDLTRWGLGCP